MINDIEKLDNPAWYSLSETQQSLAIEGDNIKFYHPDYCPFGGYIQNENISNHILDYSKLTGNFFIVGEKPTLPDSLKFKNELICLQMVADNKINIGMTEDIVEVGTTYPDELARLVNLVQPGYFKKKTFLLGNYFGIFKDNKLIAVTGERMRMDKYIEVSAVVTHPAHTGKGYAKQLVAHAVNGILAQDQIPYLHVAETNTGAIKLYQNLGFQTRRKISFWNITK